MLFKNWIFKLYYDIILVKSVNKININKAYILERIHHYEKSIYVYFIDFFNNDFN